MTIETLNAIKSEAEALQLSIDNFGATITFADDAGNTVPPEVDSAFESLTFNLGVIYSWVLQAIADGTVEEPQITVMQAFLAELKTVFEKYSAVLSIIDGSGGYGIQYGAPEGADVIQFTVTDPTTGTVSTKEFIQTSLSAVDL